MTLPASPRRLIGPFTTAALGRIAAALATSGLAHVLALGWLSDALILGRAHPAASQAPPLVVMLEARPATRPGERDPTPDGAASAASVRDAPGPVGAVRQPASADVASASAASTPQPGPVSPQLDALHLAVRAASGPAEAPEFVGPFLPPAEVDQHAYPLNGPRMAPFATLQHYSGAPIRLRLYVDADGRVVKARILEAREGDREAALLLTSAWEHIQFVAARRAGEEVASYMDVEFQLADWLGQPLVK